MGTSQDLFSIFIEAYRASLSVETFEEHLLEHGVWMNRNASDIFFKYLQSVERQLRGKS